MDILKANVTVCRGYFNFMNFTFCQKKGFIFILIDEMLQIWALFYDFVNIESKIATTLFCDFMLLLFCYLNYLCD